MSKTLTIIIALTFAQFSNAQAWKSVRHEAFFGVGVSNFLGDLGGARGTGTHDIRDLKFRSTRPAIMAGYKYTLNQYLSVKGSLTWATLNGDDAVTKNPIRNNRNLSFRSFIGEATAFIEYFPYAERVNPRYKIRGIKGNKAFSLEPYFFTGIGFLLFNPKARLNGEWIELQPLGTEGQGLAGRPEKYKRYTISVPLGAGIKYRIDKQWAVSFELSLRYSFSDYIDDVSTSYFLADEILVTMTLIRLAFSRFIIDS